jgi:hypothetical protein
MRAGDKRVSHRQPAGAISAPWFGAGHGTRTRSQPPCWRLPGYARRPDFLARTGVLETDPPYKASTCSPWCRSVSSGIRPTGCCGGRACGRLANRSGRCTANSGGRGQPCTGTGVGHSPRVAAWLNQRRARSGALGWRPPIGVAAPLARYYCAVVTMRRSPGGTLGPGLSLVGGRSRAIKFPVVALLLQAGLACSIGVRVVRLARGRPQRVPPACCYRAVIQRGSRAADRARG